MEWDKIELSEDEKLYITQHLQSDTADLLLRGDWPDGLRRHVVIRQIEARQKIRHKLPDWYANSAFVFPETITVEQCSSWQTARYKQRLVQSTDRLCDLTGGLGIDCSAFARKVQSVIYIDLMKIYCAAAEHNFALQHLSNVTVLQGAAEDLLSTLPGQDVFYIDPARRGEADKRVYALHDCTPNLVTLAPLLLAHSPKVIAKLSPMADVQHTLSLLPYTTEVHVLSVRNECKELLFVMQREAKLVSPMVYCCNFTSDGNEESFAYTLSDEEAAAPLLADAVHTYLYEPHAAVLKAGAFKLLSHRFSGRKATYKQSFVSSMQRVEGFPGRTFVVEKVLPFNGKVCKQLASMYPKANISTRNFPLNPTRLQERCKIKDGGEVYIFGTTLQDNQKVLLVTRKD